MVKKRGLGKSLDALLSYSQPEAAVEQSAPVAAVAEASSDTHEKLTQLPVDQIQRGKYQPRRDMDPQALEDLANSISSQGIIQPLLVRPIGNKFEIIAGERRWRAAMLAGLTEVPVIIRHIPDESAIAMALIENIQRENLNPIEEAFALDRLIQEFGMTHQKVAESVGKSRTSVTNLLRLLVLPDDVKHMIERGLIEMGHARTLITLPEAIQLETAQLIVTRGLSVRETESLVRRLQAGEPTHPTKKPVDPDIASLQDNLSRQLKLKVAIQCNAKGKGKLVIHYKSLRELDSLLHQFEDVPQITR